mgnify:CR=1 FL=1
MTRRVGFTLFMVGAMEDDALIHLLACGRSVQIAQHITLDHDHGIVAASQCRGVPRCPDDWLPECLSALNKFLSFRAKRGIPPLDSLH